MKRIQKAANSASKSICSKCSYKDANLCSSTQRKMCQNAFNNGFVRGANNYKEHLWKSADKNPKKNVPLLLLLSNETMALGNFEGWGLFFRSTRRYTARESRSLSLVIHNRPAIDFELWK